MRLSIKLDDDVYAIARSLAQAEDITLGAAINRLARHGVTVRPAAARARRRNGLPVSRGRTLITADTVRQAEQEDDDA